MLGLGPTTPPFKKRYEIKKKKRGGQFPHRAVQPTVTMMMVLPPASGGIGKLENLIFCTRRSSFPWATGEGTSLYFFRLNTEEMQHPTSCSVFSHKQ
jgi:hypothetical protein